MTTHWFRNLNPSRGPREDAARRRAARRRRPTVEAMESRQLLATFTVTHLGDNAAGTADIPGTLRSAIDLANAAPAGTAATINFAIGTGAQTISLLQPLPTLGNPFVIDGSTQPGFAGRPIIQIDGSQAGPTAVGFTLTDDSHNSTIKGLEVNNFSGGGILINNGTFDTITNDVLGLHVVTNLARVAANAGFGVELTNQANNNTLTNLVVAGNSNNGVVINNSANNTLSGSFIGTDATGVDSQDRNALTLGNGLAGGGSGVILNGAANHNTVSGNVIVNNRSFGIQISDAGTTLNTIVGNKIGTDKSGAAALPNLLDGVAISNGASQNFIGLAGQGNVISGNGHSGVFITSTAGGTSTTSFNSIAGNQIGTNAAGTAALPNALDGVIIAAGSVGNAVGTTDPGGGNLISGNGTWGVFITDPGTGLNKVQGNLIGTDATGSTALPNHNNGIDILQGATNNTVGGTTAGARNVVSGNAFEGVLINDPGTSKNVVEGDYIGTDRTGTVALPNGADGVYLGNGATGNLVGGLPNNAPYNVISGNAANGILIAGTGTNGNTIDGNDIGTDVTGTKGLGNRANGVQIQAGATGTYIGAGASGIGYRNVISGNAADGILSAGEGTVVSFAVIGTDSTTQLALGNGGNGIELATNGSFVQLVTIRNNGAFGIVNTSTGTDDYLVNSIYGNGLGGILNSATAALVPRPLLTGVTVSPGLTTIYGTLANPSQTRSGSLTIQFFTSPASVTAASIQGLTFIGQATVQTDAQGNANFAATLNVAVPAGLIITATVTDPNQSTSMFGNPVTAPAPAVLPAPAPSSSASFLGVDTTTQGNWKGNYGQDGYDIAQDPSTNNPQLPANTSVSLVNNGNFTYTTTSTDPRALQEAGNITNRVAGVWYNPGSFSINVNLKDGQPHRVALYALDFDKFNRSERIDVISQATGAVLDTQTVSNFAGGRYLIWSLTGNVTFKVTNLNPGINGVISGLFFGGAITGTATAGHDTDDPILPQLSPTPLQAISTVPSNGDQNPYGVAYVPPTFPGGGTIHAGDILVSNFNNKANAAGTGSTIVRITPTGQSSTFYRGAPGLGLTTALGVLSRGFVVVGSVPTTTKGKATTVHAGSLLILDKSGHVVANLANSKLLDGPWDLAIDDRGATASVFVSNVLSGTVTRIDLAVPATGSKVVVKDMVQIASGYAHRLDAASLVLGPAGLAYNASTDTLYVASTADDAIYAYPNAEKAGRDHGRGTLVTHDTGHLHGPLGLALASNGDLIVANSDGVNADPKQPSEIVEFTPAGKFVAQFSISPKLGAAPFGIAISTVQGQLRLAAVNDDTNKLDIFAWPKAGKTS